MTEQPKSKLMARLRQQRKREGLVRVELWLTPNAAAKVKKYAAKLASNTQGARND